MSDPVDKTVLELDPLASFLPDDYLLVSRPGANNKMRIADFLAQSGGSLGTMAAQNADAVDISGGQITGLEGDMTVDGNVTAHAFIGSGAGLTGIAGATGGVINTGSTTIGADSDSDGVGVVDLQTRAQTRLRIGNDGVLSVWGRGGALWSPFAAVYYAAEFATFAAAVAAIGSTRASLVVSSLSPVAANLTVPANIALAFVGPGGLQPANGVAVTLLCSVTAGPWQVFFNALAGQGTILLTGNQTGIRLNIKWWGAVGDDATDNTAVLNAVIAAAHTMQVATIDAPPGVYRIDGASSGAVGYKARVNMPAVTPAGEWDQITIQGSSAGPGVFGTVVNPNLPTTKATIFKTTASGDAMIGGTNAGSFTAVKLILKNLVLRCPDNPNVIALDMSYVLGFDLDEVIIDTGKYTTACAQPTNPAGIGLRGVVFAAGGDQIIRKLAISGFYTGLTNTEQLYCQRLILSGNWVGMEMQTGVHNSRFEYVDVYNNHEHIKVTGQNGFSIGMLNLELATVACMPTLPTWQETILFLDDPSNLGRGSIYYQNSTACGSGVDDIFKRSGGRFFNLRQISKNVPLSFMVANSASQAIPSATATPLSWNQVEYEAEYQLVSAAIPFTVYTVPISGLYEVGAVVEVEPTAAGATFQMNLLKGATKIDNDIKPAIGSTWNVVLRVRRQVLLVEGDQISVTLYHDYSGARLLPALPQTPRFSILKIQN